MTLLLLFGLPSAAWAASDELADQWLPRTDGATWTYRWSDSSHARTPTLERYTLAQRDESRFQLNWTTDGLGNGPGTVRSGGTMSFDQTRAGLVNLNWTATPPPPNFPILCPQANGCANSLAGTLFMVIWGSREPVLSEPLLRDREWSSLGGADNDVASESRYLGEEEVEVPAFPDGVEAAEVRSEITQAGAIGDPYGSGVRRVWWVRGVGPVKVLFWHAGRELGRAELVSTNMEPLRAPRDLDYFPMERGDRFTFRWRNSKHMRRWSTQRFEVSSVAKGTARIDVEDVRGPIRVAGSYIFSHRLDGLTNLAARTQARTRVDFPRLGPRRTRGSRRRHFHTPFDLMTFGFSPVFEAFPNRGDAWRSDRRSRDYEIFGVTGRSHVAGYRRVRTPAGRFRTLVVKSALNQRGYRFGSGRRTMYFAPGEGLVKLVFRHRDGSVSRVERVR